ncbi:hypothetical protein OG280_41370 (plasmid) [Streptomyces virginiae]|uniref:hypothetical protein n=1 Tax=Streptomyces TaxID=1883 RepID=UPI00136DF961|nr:MULTISPECIES: hypothetical protein [Streptomyces]MCX5278233.1 hypothetical protein [Streptomyces virginiae]MYV79400.1 hypothetical protein [Streptomyces sp. SID1046]WSC82799.1 hypothetical protein OHA56_41430 [Streptomyces virginiae]
MSRSTFRSPLSSRRRGQAAVIGLLTAGMIALAGQGTAFAAEQPAESRTAATTVAADRTGNVTLSVPGIDPIAWLETVGDVISDVVTPKKDNTDWQ